jgi:hypothetical protein
MSRGSPGRSGSCGRADGEPIGGGHVSAHQPATQAG